MKPILWNLLLLVCAFSSQALAQTPDQWIYTDSLNAPWIDDSGASVNYNGTQHVYSGTHSVAVVEDGWSAVEVRTGPWGQAVDVNPNNYSHIEFALYSTTPALAIEVYVANDDGGLSDGFIIESIPAGQWVLVSIPMTDLNPEAITINTVGIGNPSPRDGMSFSIDAIRLVGQPSSGTPSTPSLLSLAANATGASTWPTLSWLSSSGATSYKLQVSSDQGLSTVVFQDSTISLTHKQVPELSNSTAYYWRVRAKNGSGSSAYSSARRFDTGAPNTSNEVIYQDDLLGEWTTVPSNGVTLTLHQSTHVYSGAYALKVHAAAWGVLVFRDGDWGPIAELHPSDYDSLAFEFYSEKSGVELVISVASDEFDLVGNYSLVASVANQWVHVSVPMSALDPVGVAIRNVYFTSEYNKTFNYYLDNVRFVAHPQSGSGPGVPNLATPSNGASSQPLFTMLKWHPCDTSTINYQLEVATDSGFSSLIFNDSTIVDTSRMMTQLQTSTTYYWRANSRNSVGRGSWSTSRHFTTRPDTVPTLVVAPVNPTIPTIPSVANKFIYSGPNRVQYGMDTSALSPIRFATVRGVVMTREMSALGGVRVSILDHPESGYTFTRSNGAFDMVVNGGGVLNVVLAKDEYLPTQRQVAVPWHDYAVVDTVVMTRLDSKVATINLSQPSQIAFGSVTTDADGSRRTAVMIPHGITATLTASDSSQVTLGSFNFRATEYTVGPLGKRSMPGDLPPSSAYTYCVELSADEVIASGAHNINFSEPVPVYVTDFLHFPAGTTVPVGYFDKTRGEWIASENGIVLSVTSVNDSMAALDVTGDGVADSDSLLVSLGISHDERIQMKSAYQTGDTLWRFAVSHFTAWDANWGFSPPNDATLPDLPGGYSGSKSVSDPCKSQGNSTILIQNQALGETLPLDGTGYTLNYTSERSRGRKADFIAHIPLTGSLLPASVQRIDLAIQIAGTVTNLSFSPQTNQTYTYLWNGLDTYGRPVIGVQPLLATITYVYSPVYSTTSRFGYNGNGTPITGNRARGELYFSQEWRGRLGIAAPSESDLAGWSVDVHHVYDPVSRTLCFGDGRNRRDEAFGNVITSIPGTDVGGLTGIAVAPDGTLYFSAWYLYKVFRMLPNGTVSVLAGTGGAGFAGDGGLANQAQLNAPTGVSVGPDGSVYIVDQSNYRIRRVDPRGIISTVAGNGTYGSTGDGGVATNARIEALEVASGFDGSVYFSEYTRIRRISPDGIITTVAGTGEDGSSGDGGKALDALITPHGLALSRDGSIYFADDKTVRKVSPDGKITRVAGNPDSTALGDGGPALEAALGFPQGIAVAPDGSVYLSDYFDNRVRVVRPDGIITSVAGTGAMSFNYVLLPNGDGGPATSAVVSLPMGIALAPDGGVLVCDNPGWTLSDLSFGIDPLASRVRRIALPLPGLESGETAIASEDGAALFVFDSTGRHLRTEDVLTRKALLQFSYGSSGLLSTITDRVGLVSHIERDSIGRPTSLLAPFGQRTNFTMDSTGYIGSVTNPAGEAQHFAYASGGLMTARLDARDYYHIYGYDSLGLLTLDQDPVGGYTSLSRNIVNDSGDFEIQLATAEGRRTKYKVEQDVTGKIIYTNTDASGRLQQTTTGTDGTVKVTGGDGTLTSIFQSPDPQFAMQAPLESRTITTPAGLTAHISRSRTITELTGIQVTGLVDSATFNGHPSTVRYDGTQHTFLSTSPEGRVAFARVDTIGRVVQDSVPGILSTHYAYNTQGLLTAATQGTRTTNFSYNGRGRLATVTDPLNRATNMYYDSVGRVTRQVLADGREILYAYDADGNLTSLTPPGKPAHAFEYTPVDLTHKYAPPEIAPDTLWATQYMYNLDKQITHTFFPEGDSIVVQYDTSGCNCASVGRPAKITFDRGSLSFAYDSSTGNLRRVVAPGNDTLFYTYDGSLPLSARWSGNVNGTVSVKYDSSFRVIQQKINGADSIAFGYDNDGLLKTAGTLKINRDGVNGFFMGDTLGSIVTSVDYNNLGEMSSYQAKYGGTSLFTTSYARDSVGRITTLTETIQGVTKVHRYGYDLAGRLKQVFRNDTLQATYYYDPNGNQDSVVTPSGKTAGIYDSQDRMLTFGNANYFYTKRGSLSMKIKGTDTTRYTYDILGNLTKVILPVGGVVEYLIDSQNRRVGKKLNGSVVARWIYSGQLSPVAELDSTGAVVTRFIYATHVNVPDYIVRGDTTYRVVTDHLGSVRLVVNQATGEVTQRMDYDAWGNILIDSNPGFTPFGFAGGIYDSQIKLIRFGARDYETISGRWTSKDVIGFNSGENLYLYVDEDPLNWIDPTGLRKKCYSTEVFAGANAINTINYQSIKENREYGGWIVRIPNGSYSYTTAVPLGPTSGVLPTRPANAIAMYHTHGAYKSGYLNEWFSGTDEYSAEVLVKGNSYLGTPQGVIKQLDWKTGRVRNLPYPNKNGGGECGCD